MKRGSWPVLVALAVTFLLAFWLQRSRSGFLAIEADRERAVEIAAAYHLTVAEAMALRDLVGVDADILRWQAAAVTFAAERARLGDGFAAVAVVSDLEQVRRAAAEAGGGDVSLAWQRFRLRPEALPGLRFLAMRDRFASRAAGRD